MRYLTTSDFFNQIKIIRKREDISITDAKWLRSINAFAAKNFMISEKQKKIVCDIAEKYDIYLNDTLENEVI